MALMEFDITEVKIMDVHDALRSRHATRAYKPEAISRETVQKILEDARNTPSWANSQPWEVFVAAGAPLEKLRQRFMENFNNNVSTEPEIPRPVWPPEISERVAELAAGRMRALGIVPDDQEARKKMGMDNYKFFDAPVVIYLCMARNLGSWSMYDLGAFSQSIMLAAQNYGLNTIPAVMLAGYPDLIRAELGIPAEFNIIIGIALGYGDQYKAENKFISSKRAVQDFARFMGF
jgi:nitroreductase